MHMFKRFTSLLLAALMVFSLIPGTALYASAAEAEHTHSHEETHSVTFYDGYGNVVEVQSVPCGDTPVAPEVDELLIDEENDRYGYFAGWEPEIVPATEDAVYTAVYDLPEGDIELYADDNTLTGLNFSGLTVTYTDASNTSGSASWSGAGNAITGKATGYKTRQNYQINTSITFKNTLPVEATLKFDWKLTDAYSISGTGKLEGAVTASVSLVEQTASGSYSGTVPAGESITVTLYSPKGKNTDTLSITNILFYSNAAGDIAATFQPGEGGTFTVNGESITAETVMENPAATEYTLKATPAEGYLFQGWYNVTTSSFASGNETYKWTVLEAQTMKPVFVRNSVALFGVADMKFTDLTEAGTYAQSGTKKITLLNSGTLTAGNYVIPDGVTLLIPFDEAATVYTKAQDIGQKKNDLGLTLGQPPKDWETPYAYRLLTMPQGSSITFRGSSSLNIGGKHSAGDSSGQSTAGSPSGALGMIKMESGSSIVMENGSVLYCWGYIYGSGTVTAKSGSKVHENFQFTDFKGGNASGNVVNANNGVFPMSQYYVQNIEVALTLEYGSSESLWSSTYALASIQPTGEMPFIGAGSMFAPAAGGTVTKRYDPSTDRLIVEFDGGGEINPLAMSVAGIDISSEKFNLPLNSNITINLKSGRLVVNQSLAMLPGSELIIAKGATAVLASGDPVAEDWYVGGHNAFIYDRDEWFYGYTQDENQTYTEGKFVHVNCRLRTVKYSPSGKYQRTEADLKDATVDINGTLITEGYAYTTKGGANVISSQKTGQIIMSSGVGYDAYTIQFNCSADGKTLTALDIPATSIKLKNGDGTFTETATYTEDEEGAPIPTTTAATNAWGYCATCDKWAPLVTITFNKGEGTGSMASQTVTNCGCHKLSKNTFSQKDKVFDGWKLPDGSKVEDEAVITATLFSDNITLTATFDDANKVFEVIWNVNGTTYQSETAKGDKPVCYIDESKLVKAPDETYHYTFAGWSYTEGGTVVTEFEDVTENVTLYAVFTATKHDFSGHECRNCDYVRGHNLTYFEEFESNCIQGGNDAYWACDWCCKYFLDADGKQETTYDAVHHPEDPNNHIKEAPGTEYFYDKDNHWNIWKCCDAEANVAAHVDSDNNHLCDVCGYQMSQCVYDQQIANDDTRFSVATCQSAAKYYYSCKCGKCENDANHYFTSGEKDPTTHTGSLSSQYLWDGDNHWYEWSCCHKHVKEEAHADLDSDHLCDTCYYEMSQHALTHYEAIKPDCCHGGNIEYWYCSTCGKYFSDAGCTKEVTQTETLLAKDPTNHTGKPGTEWVQENGKHYHVYSCCGAKTNEADCCGGTATCTSKATCEVCGKEYGTVDKTNHTKDPVWEHKDGQHWQVYKCCNTTTEKESCVFDQKTANYSASKTVPNCTHGTEYYYSCKCGNYARSGETWFDTDIIPDKHPDDAHIDMQTWQWNETSHWHEWKCCHKHEYEEKHVDMNGDHFCDSCGYQMSQHEMVHTAAKTPNCQEKGNIEYWYCTGCQKYFSDEAGTNEIQKSSIDLGKDLNNHTGSLRDSHNEHMHWQYYDCCPETLINRDYHSYDQMVIDDAHFRAEATCQSGATYYYSCSCGYYVPGTAAPYFEVGQKNPDNHIGEAEWCYDDGGHYQVWSGCNCMTEKAAHQCTEEVVDPIYCYKEADCCSGAKYFRSCECGYSDRVLDNIFEVNEKDPNRHTGEIDWDHCYSLNETYHIYKYDCCGAEALRDVHYDNNGDHYCNDCGYQMSDHELEHHAATVSTCCVQGMKEYWECTYCSKYYLDAKATQETEWHALWLPLDYTNHEEDAVYTPCDDEEYTKHQVSYPCCDRSHTEDHHFDSNHICKECGAKEKVKITFVIDVYSESILVEYGKVPVYNGEPGKTGDSSFIYTFTGWDKELVAATEPATYTAVFAKTGWQITETGRQYILLDEVQKTGWTVIDGFTYYLDPETGYAATGLSRLPYPYGYAPNSEDVEYAESHNQVFLDKDTGLFLMSEEGVFQNDVNGLVYAGNELAYAVNGHLPWHCGLVDIDGHYYYFLGDKENGGNKMATGDVYVTRTNGINGFITGGVYTFFESGTLCKFDGIIEVNGKLRYYENYRLALGAGLIMVSQDLYFVRSNGELVVGTSYWVGEESLNGFEIVPGMYEFDEDGRMLDIKPSYKNGIVRDEDGVMRYYVNGKIAYNLGLIEYGDGYIYVRSDGTIATGKYWVTNTNGLVPQGSYNFDENGKMETLKSGFVEEDGVLHYYQYGKLSYNLGVIQVEGNYYYVKSNGEVVRGRNYWITNVGDSGLVAKEYNFDENGVLQNPEFTSKKGIIDGYYYVEGRIAYGAGLVEYNGGYIYVRSNGMVATGEYWITNTNGLLPQGKYTFGDDGMMIR